MVEEWSTGCAVCSGITMGGSGRSAMDIRDNRSVLRDGQHGHRLGTGKRMGALERELPQPVATLPQCFDNRASGAPQRDPRAEPSELSPRGGEEVKSRPVGGVNGRPDKESETGPEAERDWWRGRNSSRPKARASPSPPQRGKPKGFVIVA